MVAAAQSRTVETPPQGLVQIEIASKSEALIGSPFHQAPVFSGTIEAVAGSWLSPVSVGEGPGWEEGQWAARESGSPRYYVLVTSGSYEGFALPVLSNIGNAVALEVAGLDASLLEDETFKLIPYWTLGTLFTGQAEVGAASEIDGSDASVEVQLYSPEPKRNKQPSTIFYYYGGDDHGGAGWRMAGARENEIFDDVVIAPGDCALYRNYGHDSLKVLLPGYVQMAATATLVTDLGVANDEYLSLVAATPVSLADSRLLESGAFAGAPIISGARGDLLMIFDNDRRGLGKVSTEGYYYYTGSAFGGAGWRRKGRPITMKFDDAEVFQPGHAFAIRKTVGAEEGDYIWTYYPSYREQ